MTNENESWLTSRELIYREFREFKEDTKHEFETIRKNTTTNVRWIIGIVIVLLVTITGAAINTRIQIETMNRQQDYFIKQTEDQENRIRYLEKYIGHIVGGGPP